MARRFTSTLDVRISSSQDEALRWYAAQVGCSVADLVRELLPSVKPHRSEMPDVAPQLEDLRERLVEAVAQEQDAA
jgi:hypothetical protein